MAAYDEWASKKGVKQGYSRRSFARWAGIASPNFLSLVISGKRRLTGSWFDAFVKASKITRQEAEYLSLLSLLEEEKSLPEKLMILQKIESLLEKRGDKSYALTALELSREPLAWDLLQMLDLVDREDCNDLWFKHRLRQEVSVPEIRRCLALLLKTKLIQRNDQGAYEILERHLQTPDQVKSAENVRFHQFVLNESREALTALAPDERNFGSLTIGLPNEKIEDFKKELSIFGKMLIRKYGGASVSANEIYRLNLQLYPVTIPSQKKDKNEK